MRDPGEWGRRFAEESVMATARTLHTYLADLAITYDEIRHPPTPCSMRTAEVSRISGDCLVKGVVVRDAYGYTLAVLPASYRIRLADLERQIGQELDLAGELELEQLFPDCAPGAIPPIGGCYGLDTIIDESIECQPELYFEAGDHATLIHVNWVEFGRQMGQAHRGRFAEQV